MVKTRLKLTVRGYLCQNLRVRQSDLKKDKAVKHVATGKLSQFCLKKRGTVMLGAMLNEVKTMFYHEFSQTSFLYSK